MTELSPVVGFGAVGLNTRDESLFIFAVHIICESKKNCRLNRPHNGPVAHAMGKRVQLPMPGPSYNKSLL